MPDKDNRTPLFSNPADLISQHQAALLAVAEDGSVTLADERAQTLLSTNPAALYGQNIFGFISGLPAISDWAGRPDICNVTLPSGLNARCALFPAKGEGARYWFVALYTDNDAQDSLAFYNAMLEWVPVPILIFSQLQQAVIGANDALVRMFGSNSREHFLSHGPLSPDKGNPLRDALMAGGLNAPFEIQTPHPARRSICLQCAPAPLPAFEETHQIVLLNDITAQREGAQELQRSKNTLQAIISNAVDGIIIIDSKGLIQMTNEATTRLFGYQEEEMIGQNIRMLMPEPHRSQHDGYIQNYHNTGVGQIIGIGREVKGKKKNGTYFPFRLGVSKIETEEGLLFTGVIHDLTEEKIAEEKIISLNRELEQKVEERTEKLTEVVNKLLQSNLQLEQEIKERKAAEDALRANEEELRKALEREKELSELKSRFVSMASHEFRTPLTTIASSSELIGLYTSGDQQEKREKHLKRIRSAVTNLTGILGDFLSLSKLEEGKIHNAPTAFVLENLLAEIEDDMHTLLKTGQKLEKVLVGVRQEIRLDQKILKNIFINLLSNAIKYSPPGSAIQLKASLEGGKLAAHIKDEGIGIPESDQKHLFSRFFRAENAVNIQGTGLGLNIVHRYLELLNGQIWFESTEGKGTTFFFEIPLGQGG